jgi:signal transduction histidine kinase
MAGRRPVLSYTIFSLFLLCTARVFPAGGISGGEPAYAFSRQWLVIERAALLASGEPEGLLEMIGEFRASLEAVFQTPLYETYRFNPRFSGETVRKVFELSGAFEEAVRAGRREALPALALDMHGALTRWQEEDAKIADSVHLGYFYQFFIFAAVIGLLTLAVWRLGRALTRSRIREEQSAAFSRVMVMAQEAERSRISRELHDSAAQELRYQALRVAKIARTENREERSSLCAEVALSQEALTGRIRDICDGLFPPDFRYQGLPDALGRLCRDFGTRTGIDCRLTLEEASPLAGLLEGFDADRQLHCFRLVQEALTNIEKHAAASEAVVVVRSVPEDGGTTLLICVSDDGRGFDVSPSPDHAGGHYGIRGMYARAAILGGSLRFESEGGEGLTVIITVPLNDQ